MWLTLIINTNLLLFATISEYVSIIFIYIDLYAMYAQFIDVLCILYLYALPILDIQLQEILLDIHTQ